jgi:hypothetical protein
VPAEPASETFAAEVAPAPVEFDLPFVRVQGVEPELGPEPEAAPVAEFVEYDFTSEAVAEPAVDSVPEPQPEPLDSGVDFERDLLALGLGELPADLLGSPEEPPAVAEQAWIDPAAEAPEPTPGSSARDGDVSAEVALDEIAELTASLDLPVEVPVEVTPVQVAGEDAVDFSELLESLDLGPEIEAEPIVVEPAPDFDEELLREVAPAGETGGVISTDAYLEDITIDDLGFTGGLTDELSALTGMDRPARPTANVNRIPDSSAEGVLHRDTRVDKDTLLKIIDGIKRL